MRILEEIQLKKAVCGRDRAPRGTVLEADGVLVLELDEDFVRNMSLRALEARGQQCKAGPIRVRFQGVAAWRPVEAGEELTPPEAMTLGRVFASHPWASRRAF